MSIRAIVSSFVAVALFTAVKLLVEPIGSDLPFLLYFGAVLVTAWYEGRNSGFFTTALAAGAANYWFLPPQASFALEPIALLQTSVFIVECLMIALLVDGMKSNRNRLERLQAITAALSVARTPKEVGEVVAVHVAESLRAGCAVFARNAGTDRLDILAARGVAELEAPDMSSDHPAGAAIRGGVVLWNPGSAMFSGVPPVSAALPLGTGREGAESVLVAFREDPLRDVEKTFLASVAELGSQALERASLHADVVGSRQRLQRLADLAFALSTALDQKEVAEVVVSQGMAASEADTCTLYAFDETGGALELIADRGVAPEVLEQIRRIPRDSDNPMLSVLESGQGMWVETEEQYHALYPKLAATRAKGPRAKAFWGVPLVVEGRPIGLIGVGFYEPRRFPPAERAFVIGFAHQCAQALRRAERVRNEQRARLAAEQARSWLETTLLSIGDAVIATDTSGRITFMNPVAEALTGYAESEARGQPLGSVFHIINEKTRLEVESPVDKVLREGTVVGLANHTILVGKNAEVPIDDSGAPIRDASGAIQGVVLVFRSVSREKVAEQRREFLEKASAELGSSLDYRQTLARVAELAVPRLADWCAIDIVEEGQTLPERIAVAHIDPEKVRLAHELYERYPPRPDAPRGVPHVVRTARPELYEVVTDELLVAGAVDEDHLRIARELRLRSVLIVPLVIREAAIGAMTLVYAERNQRYTEDDLAFASDFASRAAIAIENSRLFASERRQRSLADSANRAKDEFLATVSHELRTPLNAILGWAHMLSRGALDEQKRQKAADAIERNSIAMAQLIEDLLDVSRIVSGKMRLEIQPVEPSGVIEAAIESVKPAADAKEIVIHYAPEPCDARVMGDPHRLQQIVWNLLSNAVKFTHKGGRIDILLRRAGSSVEIAVTDNGRGIDPRFLPHVFDAFRQADGTVSRAHGGLGLGLAICRHLTELHGGVIEALSEGEGRGTSFRVRLPVPVFKGETEKASKPRATPGPVISAVFEQPDLGGLRVLVVDDEEDARQMVSAALEQCGASVLLAGSAAEALGIFESTPVDVVVSDIGMPGQSGYDLMRSIRALPDDRGSRVPAAALTAYARPADRLEALEAGFSLHVAKPVDPGELVEVVANLGRISRTLVSSADAERHDEGG